MSAKEMFEELKINEWLELIKEDKNLNGAYIFISQYIYLIQQENQKYKEVIFKIDKYINDYNVFEVFSFPLMKRWEEEQVKSSIDYEFKTSLIKDLKDILKEVE